MSTATADPVQSTSPLSLTHIPHLRRQGMRMSLWEGFFSHVHVALTGPGFLTGYLLMLGVTNWTLGVLCAIPHFLQVFQIVSAYATTHVGSRKAVCCTGITLFRGVHLVLAALPFIPGLGIQQRLMAVVALLLISNVGQMFVANSWSIWMADLVPARIRGRYFGVRSGLALCYNTFWSLAGGAVLDYYTGKHQQAYGFALLFCMGSIFAFGGLIVLRRQWEPPLKQEPHPSAGKLLQIFKCPEFRAACAYLFTWNFGAGLSGAFAAKFMLAHLHMSFQEVMLYPVVVNMVGFACAKPWGKLMDAFGTRATTIVCSFTIPSISVLWLFAGPAHIWPIWLDAVLSGLFFMGLTIGVQNLPLVVTPERHKMHYVGIFTTISGLGLGISSVMSGKLADMLAGFHYPVPALGQELVNYHVLFALSGLFRVGSVLFLLLMSHEQGRSRISNTAALLRLPRLLQLRAG